MSSTTTVTSHSSSESGPVPPCRHLKIQLGDPAIVKHTLDEQAAMYLLDQGYVEDVSLSNLKLGLGVFSVLLTIAAQFYPAPFPQNTTFLGFAVVLYFVIQGLLQLLYLLVEQDCILLTRRRSEQSAEDKKKPASPSASSASSSQPQLSLPPYATSLQATLTRYQTEYKLTLSTRNRESIFTPASGSDKTVPDVSVSSALQVTDYFDVNGVFLMEKYQASLRQLLQRYTEAVQKGASAGSKKNL